MTEIKFTEQTKLKRELGLFTVVFFIFGYVVGAGILIQAGVAAGITGPALWLAFIIAGIPALISSIVIIYLVSSMPVSGGSWVYSSRLGSPFIGFMVLVSTLLNIMGSLALLAVGFGTYFELFIPGTLFIAAIVLIIIFYIINLTGVKIAAGIQVIMAICGDFLVIMLFIIFGLPNIDPSNLAGKGGNMFPTGVIGILMGAAILSFSYAGFVAIIEIGGEVKNPKRNIPLGVIISFVLVTTVYILISIVMIGNMDWRSFGEKSTLLDVAALFFPGWFVIILNVLVLIAIASTFHGVLLAYSRDLFAASRDRIVPQIFSKLNKKEIPIWSITFIIIGTLIILFSAQSIIALSVLCNFTITVASFVLAYIPLNMKKFEKITENSKIKIKRRTLIILVIVGVAYSTLLFIVMILMEPMVIISASIFYLCAIGYYFLRKQQLKKQGIDLAELCNCIPDEVLD